MQPRLARQATMPLLGRRRVLMAGVAAALAARPSLAATTAPGAAGERHTPALALPGADQAARIWRVADAAGEPVVLMFSLAGCPYCEALRREQLIHLHRDERRAGVRVLELDLQDARPLSSPIGASETPSALAARLGIRVAPTVLFLGGEREIAPRLVGYGSRDFYGAYLEERISTARRALGRP